MGYSFCFDWELSFLEWLQSAESPLLNALAKCVTLVGEDYFLILVVGLCFWCIDKRLGRNVSLGVAGSLLFGCLIQGIIPRRRPYFDHSEIKCIREAHPGEDPMSEVAQGYSLPSLHSTLSVGGYGTLALNAKKRVITCIAVVLPFLVGLSRLYLGVHYPTDILCGWVVGAAVLVGFGYLEKKYGYKICFIIQLAVGAVGFFFCKDNGFYTVYGVIAGLLLGFWYEEKFVQFRMNKKWWSCVLRTALGVILFIVLSALLKLPVRSMPADEHMTFQFCYRCFRYALSTFAIMGLYPRLFKRLRFL